MRSSYQSTWTDSKVYGFVSGVLVRHLSLTDFGRTCPVVTLLAVWLLAAARRLSLSAASLLLAKAPSDETIRKATLKQLPSMRELERQLNAALCNRLPSALRRQRQIWAIDLTEKPYYGKSQGIGPQLRRGKPKQGTTKFHSFASLYVVHRGQRFTLAVTYVWRKDTLPAVLARLIAQARKRGISPRFLLLDRQFYNLDVVLFLQRHRVPFLMPVVHRGRRAKDPAQAQGTQQFLTWQRSGRCQYTMRNNQRTAEVTILVAVDEPARKKKGRRRKGKGRRRVLVFAAWGWKVPSPARARETYRRRFGIETSYRQAHQAQAWTTSRSCKLRLLLFGLALLLRNAWVWLHRCVLSRPLPNGAFAMLPNQLRLLTLLIHLEQEIIHLFGLTELTLPMPESHLPP
jgi:putative transposase